MAGDLQAGDPERVGPYRLLGRLGAGGMGQVYLGRSAGGRLVAIKVIRPELASDSGFRARFTQEIAAARRVSGLFTAVVVDADVAGPVPWLATGYVAGPSLAEAVETQGPLPADSVLTLAAGLAEGLEAIHATGMVHRDLKPSNVLLAGDGPRVIDFGISRAAEATALTQTGMIIGSPGFMSPEQAEGGAVGQASDVFSLGAVIAFAATGAGPFGAGSTPALMYRVVHHQPDTSRLPGQIRPLIERCLAKDPRERPTPAALLAELGAGQLAEDWLPGPLTQAIGQYAPPGLTGPAGFAGPYGRTTGTGVPGPPGRAVTEAAGGHVPSAASPAGLAGPPTAAAFYPGPTGQAGPAGPPTAAAFPTGRTVPGGPPAEAAAPAGPTIPGGPPTEAAFLPQPGAPEGRPPRRKRRGLVWALLAAGLAVAGAAAILVPRAITASPASQSQHTTGTRSAPTLSGGPQTEGTAARSATPSAVQQPSPVTGAHSTGPAARSSATPRSSATTASATPTTSSSPPSASPAPSSLAPSSPAPSTPPPTTPASGAPTQAAPSSG
jgi:eukaryotic-like serine/threonine-protein kinase